MGSLRTLLPLALTSRQPIGLQFSSVQTVPGAPVETRVDGVGDEICRSQLLWGQLTSTSWNEVSRAVRCPF